MSGHDAIQIVLAFPAQIVAFDRWLAAHGLERFPIPVSDDDLPTFAIAIKENA